MKFERSNESSFNVFEKFVEKHIDKPWDWGMLSLHPSITPEFVEKYDLLPWNYTHLSINPSITPEFVGRHVDKPWDYTIMSFNPSVPLGSTPTEPPRAVETDQRYWSRLSRDSSITPDFVGRHIDEPWDWGLLSLHPSITPEFVESHPDKPWDWVLMCRNASIPPEFVKRFFGSEVGFRPIAWWMMSYNHSISVDFLDRHKNQPWDWEALSRNPSITPDIIERRPDLPWVWIHMNSNPSITPEFIERHPDKPWDYKALSANFMEGHGTYKSMHRIGRVFQKNGSTPPVAHRDMHMVWFN